MSGLVDSPVVLSLLVAVGGAAGALARWRLGSRVARIVDARIGGRGGREGDDHPDPLPSALGIVVVNVVGCFLVGLASGALADHPIGSALVSTGFLGGFTTFSTAVADARSLWERGRRPASVGLLVGGWALAVGAGLAGIGVGAGL
ncbi:CrcB family protein [Actinomyces sp. B33]|uniref:fluoride efflux transporter FluC n=1 Tax=Actinomyces sp. B33 TaxID=2942131 RepID=UPI00233F9539|nr:CrcB family protein [Actinomyces sp. B33]MDC4233939.1 CrcB family protein [Actinomyces sp. B33]